MSERSEKSERRKSGSGISGRPVHNRDTIVSSETGGVSASPPSGERREEKTERRKTREEERGKRERREERRDVERHEMK